MNSRGYLCEKRISDSNLLSHLHQYRHSRSEKYIEKKKGKRKKNSDKCSLRLTFIHAAAPSEYTRIPIALSSALLTLRVSELCETHSLFSNALFGYLCFDFIHNFFSYPSHDFTVKNSQMYTADCNFFSPFLHIW